MVAITRMLTGLLHTRNRPEFLRRALRYYSGWFPHRLMVLDASDVPASLPSREVPSDVALLHREPATPLQERLADGLATVTTPYVVLMADDDFFFEGGLDAGVRFLEGHPNHGVVYGHSIHFELERYVPSGSVVRVQPSVPNPVARWLEADAPEDRLRELGRGPWTTVGWYAVQRTDLLRRIVSIAIEERFTTDMFERSLNLLQPLFAKVAMLDELFLARQFNPGVDDVRVPSSYAASAEGLTRLQRVAARHLSDLTSMPDHAATRVIEDVMRPEIAQLRANDRHVSLRVHSLRRKLPMAVPLVRAARAIRDRVLGRDPLATDPRFPQNPMLPPGCAARELLAQACSADHRGASAS